MVLPWLHFVLASLVLMILLVVLLLPVLVRLTRAAPECRVPWACKLAVGVYCGALKGKMSWRFLDGSALQPRRCFVEMPLCFSGRGC